MNNRSLLTGILAMALVLVSHSCGDGTGGRDGDVLVIAGKHALHRDELIRNIPGGLSPDDSTRLARAYIRTWIDNHIVADIIASDIDMEQIDRMVEDYRNELIMWEYQRRMFDTHTDRDIPEDSLLRYYDSHKEEFILSRPLVKGIYLKVADNSKSLSMLRRLYRSTGKADIDKLEKSELEGAVHYDYFRDNWIDWEQIESRIPFDFGTSADEFLRKNDHIDTSLGGFTYLLDISEYLPSGKSMPFEVAKPQIIDRIMNARRNEYNAALRRDLYENALSSGKIKIFCDMGS